jgi:hypothetical protein
MPVVIVLGVGIRTSCEQLARNIDEPRRSLRHAVMQTSVAGVQKRLPILNSARLPRAIGLLLQPCANGSCIAEY